MFLRVRLRLELLSEKLHVTFREMAIEASFVSDGNGVDRFHVCDPVCAEI